MQNSEYEARKAVPAEPVAPNRDDTVTKVVLIVAGTLLGMCLISAVGLGLLMSMVSHAREAGRRVQCQNNLRYLALAVHEHYNQHRFLPTAGFWGQIPETRRDAAYFHGQGLQWRDESGPLIGLKQPLGWGYQVLPYLEAESTWNSRQWAKIIDPAFLELSCPSRRRGGKPFCTARVGHTRVPFLPTDYAGLDLGVHSVLVPPDVFARFDRKPGKRTLDHITDGASTTLLLAEKHMPQGLVGRRHPGDWFGYAAPYHRSTMRRVLTRAAWNRLQRDSGPFSPGRETEAVLQPASDLEAVPAPHWRLGGPHPEGFNVTFCDGSVRLLEFDIDPVVLFQLVHPRDGGKASGF